MIELSISKSISSPLYVFSSFFSNKFQSSPKTGSLTTFLFPCVFKYFNVSFLNIYYGLGDDERKLLEPIFGLAYGICESQEKFM